ncbi:Glycosyltransferase involved in cell wall bisynthesis [Bacteroides luti]|uniref:Glycosyltransferase involved in cell wall bisynthesis n=1 Tax=Bacteroides luti TaxID=1297750 RepID=A0A1M4SST9_9BACE|nr:glycosyltransferase family 4 protein [Bacteroides luti]SHE35314.1 Glycosyltransferase involved in cell wall bisynthesis [Bacteroides luti]
MNSNIKSIVIVCPTLDPNNISGVSSVARFIIKNNRSVTYTHFEIGKKNHEKGGLFRILRTANNFKNWILFLREKKGCIIHYNFPITRKSALRDPLFMTISKYYSCKLIIHIHGGNYLQNNETPFWVSWILKGIFSMQTPIIVQSQTEKHIFENKFGAQNVYSLPNCIDLNGTICFERKINIDRPLTVLFIGRIVEAKGINYIYEAFKILKERGIPFYLIFAGQEEKNNQFINKFVNTFKEEFCYKGIVLNREKDELLKKSDIFLLPSFYEGLPLSLLECMSFGLTPIVTNVGSISLCVENNENGIIIKDHNSDNIIEAIEQLHNDRNKLYQLGNKSMEKIKNLFDPDKYILKLNEIYDFWN